MPHWLALRPIWPGTDEAAASPRPEAPEWQALAWLALRYTPRVARAADAVLLEVAASLRLFGGARALERQLGHEAAACWQAPPQPAPARHQAVALAAGPTSLAALALLRAGQAGWAGVPAADHPDANALLNPLPLATLDAAAACAETLSRLGCRTLGDVRALPRAGLSRRLGAALLAALDQAYGLAPESHTWLSLPDTFSAELELPGRVDEAPALLAGACRLLAQLGAWLAARHAGVRSIVLSWRHEFGAREAGRGGELRLRTAACTRQVEHLARLLGEHLARTPLAAPVHVLGLRADEVEPLPEASRALWQELGTAAPATTRTEWVELIERLSARLGPEQVRSPHAVADHRPEAMWQWAPLAGTPAAAFAGPTVAGPASARLPFTQASPAAGPAWPQPAWLLPQPQPLAVRGERPCFRGTLQLVAGPQRVEAGWWTEGQPGPAPAQRDYYVAWSPHAGLLCIYRERPLAGGAAAGRSGEGHGPSGGSWFLHGHYG